VRHALHNHETYCAGQGFLRALIDGFAARGEAELHGRRMEAGRKIALLLASANRDERRWRDPEVFDIARDTSGHVAFGFGVHCCLGAALARLEARAALEDLLARLPDFAVEPAGLVRVHSGNVRGDSVVPIRFGAL
jgi:cytochrome P450